MSRQSNVSNTVYGIAKQFKKGEIFTADNIDGGKELTRAQISAALSRLAYRGLIHKGPIKGQYFMNGGSAKVNPSKTIYDLLDFMAAAEAPLRRAAKILEAVDNA